MDVRRVATDDLGSSRVEPPFDDRWDDHTKLEWTAALTSLDCGLQVTVERSTCSGYGRRPRWDVLVGGGAMGPLLYERAKSVIDGVGLGAGAAARRAATDS